MRTKVKHSLSKPAWNVVCIDLGEKYKIARIPYLIIEGDKESTMKNRIEAMRHAKFISDCFNGNHVFGSRAKHLRGCMEAFLFEAEGIINQNPELKEIVERRIIGGLAENV